MMTNHWIAIRSALRERFNHLHEKIRYFCISKVPVNHKTGLPPCKGIGKNNIVNMLTIYLEFGNVRIFITFRS